MLRPAVKRTLCSKIISRSVATQGPVEAKISHKEHPTHKDKDEKVLAKAREVAKDAAIQQSSNREVVWSNSQQPRQDAWVGPRFEQTDFSLQPQPQAAIELIAQVPIRQVNTRIASCNGGGGALGHPKVYINLDKAGEPNVCPYCKSANTRLVPGLIRLKAESDSRCRHIEQRSSKPLVETRIRNHRPRLIVGLRVYSSILLSMECLFVFELYMISVHSSILYLVNPKK